MCYSMWYNAPKLLPAGGLEHGGTDYMFGVKNVFPKYVELIGISINCDCCIQWRNQEFFPGGSTNSVEDRGQRERGSGDGSPLVRGSGGSCNLVQEI